MISAITPEKENPIHIPKVPPTFPIKPISVTMTYYYFGKLPKGVLRRKVMKAKNCRRT